MALNSFATLVRERQERDANASTQQVPASTSAPVQHNTTQQQTMRPNVAKRPASGSTSGLIPQTKAQKYAREAAPNAAPQTQAPTSAPHGSGRVLSLDDSKMLCALSAMQIRYGKPAEAIPYLMLVKNDNPTNIKALRLLVLALMRLERWQEAELMLAELEKHEAANQGTLSDGVGYLYRSLVALKLHGLSDAKSWFNRFRKYVIGSIRGNA